MRALPNHVRREPIAPGAPASTAKADAPPKKTALDIVGTFMPLISGILLAVVGYFLTERVNASFKERELELSSAKEMRETLLKLYGDNLTAADAEASALTLAAYGPSAVAPLVRLLDGAPLQSVAAEHALRALGTTDARRVCASVAGVVGNRTQLFSSQAQRAAVRLAGGLACEAARPALRGLKQRVGAGSLDDALPAFGQIVSDAVPSRENLADLRQELDQALRRVGDR